jgi:SAM-dependent methyltransferase
MTDKNSERLDFARQQAAMTEGWYENTKRLHGDVEAYVATRYAAYLDRWKEAARFIPEGSEVLDIGGGYHAKTVLEFIKSRKYSYNYIDVDPSSVAASAGVAASLGMDSSRFRQGLNDDLPFSDGGLDAVFSSHCIEHSFDLMKTFSEMHRILRETGNLLMAVPFGWETNLEHPYFFGPTEWVSLVQDAGFKIRIAQIGCEYPEAGYDYFICGQKRPEIPRQSRINPDDYKKSNFEFLPADARAISYRGLITRKADHIICRGSDWQIDIAVPDSATEVLPVFQRHDWSGVVQGKWGSQLVTEDLYSWFPYIQPVRIKAPAASARESIVSLVPIGKNPVSSDSEGVLWGVLKR